VLPNAVGIPKGKRMGLKLEYLNDNRGVVVTASGKVTGEAVVDVVRQINAFAVTTQPICYAFTDCDRITAISVTIGDLARAAACAIEAARTCETERVVALFAEDPFMYRLALIYKAFIEQTGWEVWAFQDRAKALSWLRSRAAEKHSIEVAIH
jgi:hypothetical protein